MKISITFYIQPPNVAVFDILVQFFIDFQNTFYNTYISEWNDSERSMKYVNVRFGNEKFMNLR